MKNVVYVAKDNFVGVTKNGFKFRNFVQKTEEYFLFDDIGIIVFDAKHCYLSKRVIEESVKHDIAILFCDNKHSPIDVIESIYNQKNRLARLEMQLSLTSKVKGRLWRKIIVSKINNQAQCLKILDKKQQNVQILNSIGKEVVEGDRSKQEAYAAKIYFDTMFGKEFKRGRYDDWINSSLNYGYAILRMLIRREIICHGLEPSFGIGHVSKSNPFNLADDLIEPFRPLLDLYISKNIIFAPKPSLEIEDKLKIIEVLFEKCVVGNEIYYLGDAIKVVVVSYLRSLTEKSASPLKIPEFIQGGD